MSGHETGVLWSELHAETVERLRRGGIASPEVDARRIVERAAGFEPGEFGTGLGTPATRRGVGFLDAMVERRLAGEPLQYVVGSWGFRSLELHLDGRVLIPRPETEEVAGLAIDAARGLVGDRGDEVLVADLGTGSGAIALAVAVEVPAARVVATDVSADALAVARANLAGAGRAATRVTLAEGSWFEALPPDLRGRVDVIVSNPPYVGDDETLPAEVDDWEPRVALRAGPAGTEHLEVIVDGAPSWLAPGGFLVLEMAPDQVPGLVDRARDRGFATSVHVDLSGRPRALVARLERGVGP